MREKEGMERNAEEKEAGGAVLVHVLCRPHR